MKQLFFLGLSPFETNNCIVKASEPQNSKLALNNKKQALLIPHGNSIRVPSRRFYEELIYQLIMRGYEVIYDGSGRNPELDNFSSGIRIMESIPGILGHAVNTIKNKGIIITQRSGLSEFICNLGLPQIVLFPKYPPHSAFANFDGQSGDEPYAEKHSMIPFYHNNPEIEKLLFWLDIDNNFIDMKENLHRLIDSYVYPTAS
jgi:hypothetical protein